MRPEQTDRQTDRETDGQTNRQTNSKLNIPHYHGRYAVLTQDKQIERQTEK